MIKEAFRYPKGETIDPVVVFDEKGEQMPEFTGEYQDVRVKILARAPKSAKFFHGIWGAKGLVKQEVSRKEW